MILVNGNIERKMCIRDSPKGMPLDKTWMTGTYMYYQIMNRNNTDYSAAIAVVIAVLGIVVSRIVNVVFKEKDY